MRERVLVWVIERVLCWVPETACDEVSVTEYDGDPDVVKLAVIDSVGDTV